MRVAIYLRVSKDEQTIENQRQELDKIAVMRGWNVVAYFEDEGISGSKGREHRPGFNALWTAVENHEVDMVAAWAMDRVGRSLCDLANFMGALRKHECDLYLHQQQVDTSTMTGRFMLNVLASVAEFERDMIIERTKAGLARAKAAGKKLGKPQIAAEKQDAIRRFILEGKTSKQIAQLVGCGQSVINRVRHENTVH
jgi:DNA invertase Pin-like site-specific DNA recombinase